MATKKRKTRSAKHTKDVATINRLPDDLLVLILSRLTLREAAATSVLSQRWRTLWTHTTGSLDFDAPKEMTQMYESYKQMTPDERRTEGPVLVEAELTRFTRLVDRVLGMHQASRISEFKVDHEVSRGPSSPHLDSWIQIAIEKRVQNLHLDLCTLPFSWPRHSRYILPSPTISNFVKSPSGLAAIQSLAAIHLANVDVTSEFLEYIVQVCPLLKQISLEDLQNEHLVVLNIGHPSSRLECLSIIGCYSVVSIKVSGPNFRSFSYVGRRLKLEFFETPLLADVSISPCYPQQVHYAFAPLSSYLTQLQSLKLGISLTKEEIPEFPHFSQLKNLRYLTWRVIIINERSLLSLFSIIEASPCLRKFSLEVGHPPTCSGFKKRTPRKNRNAASMRGHSLQEVELTSFAGCELEMEIALLLLETASRLEKVFITYNMWGDLKQARPAARVLEKHLPRGAELVVLENQSEVF